MSLAIRQNAESRCFDCDYENDKVKHVANPKFHEFHALYLI